MATATAAIKLKFLLIPAIVTALMGTYFTALYIESPAKERDIFKQNSHSVVRRDFRYDTSVINNQQKVNVDEDAELYQNYSFNVNSTLEYRFKYSYEQDLASNQAISIQVTSKPVNRDNPVHVVVKQQKAIVSWQLPLLLETSSGSFQEYSSASRQLCTERNNVTVKHEFVLGVSTSNPQNLSVVASVTPVQDFVVKLDGNGTVTLAASEPKYYQFLFPVNVTHVLLTVKSDDDYCMLVSVQNLSYPAVFDTDQELRYGGIRQTLMNKTGMAISRERFPDGFFVVFVVKADDYECTGKRTASSPMRKKTVHFAIHEMVSYDNYRYAVFGVLGIFAIFYIGVFVSFCFNCGNTIPTELLEPSLVEVENTASSHSPTAASAISPTLDSTDVESELLNSLSCSSPDLIGVDQMSDASSDLNVIRTKKYLVVADLSHKGSGSHVKNSWLYKRHLWIVSLFYALPVIQLVTIYQNMMNDTGDQDLCYFNFLCAHPRWNFTDFNHIYSNLGYILLGILFHISTAHRKFLRRKLSKENRDRLEEHYGIPQHYGLFYAMGTALLVEGLLSACYHICPTRANFQFDTTFMYVICILCTLKIYQSRHPDINAEAQEAFKVLAAVAVLCVFSLFIEDMLVFQIFVFFIHLFACLAISTRVYYMGTWKMNFGAFKRIYCVFRNDFKAGLSNCCRPMYVDRMILLVIGMLTNIGWAMYGLVYRPPDFASYMLGILVTNLFLYFTFYIFMKVWHGEKILCHAIFHMVCAFLFGIPAMYFFINNAATWSKTAAESRIFNRECQVLSFYDNHDIWHFLSAGSLFFFLMTLLTLDDDLAYTPRDEIPVF
ncbi:SID1 transmembrane family member 1-like [Daphnia pulex]|uniref:SID1 transmembrane family member 1-like n=1 Tax=Daphnia pulex TaxID=6669 RepID=UPI001EDE33CD|nr:SID1 transmembrane family member 1-like [Daphnia pulex]